MTWRCSTGAELEAREAFVAAAEQWSRKRAPAALIEAAKRADDALNAAYATSF